MAGFDALAEHRAGKCSLRTHTVKSRPAPTISTRDLAKVREDMNLSRSLFAA
jgi:putative transcriptional regulator